MWMWELYVLISYTLSDAACLAGQLCREAGTSSVGAASSKTPVWPTGSLQPVSISSACRAAAWCPWVCVSAALPGENTIHWEKKKILVKSLQSHR